MDWRGQASAGVCITSIRSEMVFQFTFKGVEHLPDNFRERFKIVLNVIHSALVDGLFQLQGHFGDIKGFDIFGGRFNGMGDFWRNVQCIGQIRCSSRKIPVDKSINSCDNTNDLIFLDIVLPDANGLERIGRLKGPAAAPEITTITGKGDRARAEQALTKGAGDYLEKPLSYRHLRLLMERSLQVVRFQGGRLHQ